MKTLSKLQLNPDRVMKNDELITLRGGYGLVKCYDGWFNECGEGKVGDCGMADQACQILCGSFTYHICMEL